MSTCPYCRRGDPLLTALDLFLALLFTAALFAVLTYQIGFDAGFLTAADTCVP